jgi:hypothetical protein
MSGNPKYWKRPSVENKCAYCLYHQCTLSIKQIKVKHCLDRECRHLKKYPEHKVWVRRELIAQLKQQRKAEKGQL